MSYKHFSNIECEYYPCHGLVGQNCLFCFCPLYFMKECGGDFKMHKGVKDCAGCIKNHDEDSHEFIIKKLGSLFKIIREKNGMIYIDETNIFREEKK